MRLSLHLVAVGCVLLLGSLQSSYAEDKSDAESPAAVKAWTEYHQIDQELTDTYQKILISLDSASAREKYTDAENAWLKFRKAQGVLAAEGAPDQATYKLRMAASFTETTKARIVELKSWQGAQSKK